MSSDNQGFYIVTCHSGKENQEYLNTIKDKIRRKNDEKTMRVTSILGSNFLRKECI